MTNIDHEKFYNPELKERYLNTIQNDSTRYITMFPFMKAKRTEEELGKDVYQMNEKELELVMREQGSSSVDAAYVNAVRFEQYINWAYQEELLESNLNPITNLPNKREWAANFVAKYRQTVFTRKELMDMINALVNDIDKAVLLALFEGIVGKGYAELLNLKEKDLKEVEDDKYTATLEDADGSMRTINISKDLYDILLAANKQTEYINKNGQSEGERWSTSDLEDSPYIFKKTTRGKQGGKLDLFFINRKFTMFKEIFNAEFLKAKNIETSGIMHMAHELYNSKQELTLEDMKLIAEQFNTSMAKVDGVESRRIIIIKQILKSDLFKQLYKYEIIQ